jgi:NitT/TauT family transport system substrate-binding protein
MMFKRHFLLLILIGCMAVFLSSCAPTAAPTTEATTQPTTEAGTQETGVDDGELTTLKIVLLPFFSFAPYHIADAEGYFTEEGIKIEPIRFDDASQAVPALAQGQLDVNAGFVNVGLFNAIAAGTNIKVVADKGHIDPEGCADNAFVGTPEAVASGIQPGMSISSDAVSVDGYWLDLYLKDQGLTLDDVTLEKMFAPDDVNALRDGGIDVGMISEPWLTRGMTAGDFQMIIPIKDIAPGFQTATVMFGPNLLEKDPDLGVRFLKAYLKGVRKYNEGATDRNVEILAERLQIPAEDIKAMCWAHISNDGVPNIASILDYQAWAAENGNVPTQVTEDQLYAPSFLEEANAALDGE